MNYIIPKNYMFKHKIFGIIDYSTAFINIVWNLFLYFIIRNILIPISIKIFLFSSLSFPVLLITIIGFNNESPIYTIKYIVGYIKKNKVYLFEKKNG